MSREAGRRTGRLERLAENAKNMADAYMLCANIIQPLLEGINENERFSVCSFFLQPS